MKIRLAGDRTTGAANIKTESGSDSAVSRPALLMDEASSVRLSNAQPDLERLLAMLASNTEDSQIESSKDKVACARTLIDALSQEGVDITSGNMKLLAEAEIYSAELEILNARLYELEAVNLEELERQISGLSEEMTALEKTEKTLEKQLNELQQALDGQNSSLKELKEKCEAESDPEVKAGLEGKIRESEKAISDTESQIEELRMYQDRVRNELVSVKTALSAAESLTAETIAAIGETSEQKNAVEEKLDMVLGKLTNDSTLRTEIDKLLAEINHTKFNRKLNIYDDKDDKKVSSAVDTLTKILISREEENRRELIESIESGRTQTI